MQGQALTTAPARHWRRLGMLLATLILVCDAGAALAQSPRISWRLENPFRFFTDPRHTETHRATWEALAEEEKREPVLAAERALAERHGGEGWAATMLEHTCWDPAQNRHRCRADPNYLHPRQHRIVATIEGVPEAAGVDCRWLTAPKEGVRAAITVPCDATVKLEIPYPDGAEVTVEVGGRQVAAAEIKVEDLLVVGMGDSFGSGEGNPDVPVRLSRERSADYGDPRTEPQLACFPARFLYWGQIGDKAFIDNNPRWLDQACHRSLYSHQLRVALQLAVEQPQRAVTFVSFACSGAEIVRGLFLRYRGHEWVPTPPDLSQISAVAQEQCGNREATDFDLPEAYHNQGKVPELQGGLVLRKCDAEKARRIDLVLLSIGGNDIGFARLVANAVLADESTLRRLGGWFGQVHGYEEAQRLLGRLEERYRSLNRALRNILHVPWRQSDRIILTAYPALTLLDDGRSVCPDSRAGMTVAGDFALSERKARDSMTAAERLDRIMAETSRAHGWTFVRAHRPRFNGRSICAGWTENAISTADDLRLPRRVNGEWEPFNPAEYRPYASRQRWFRTPNDAFLTGHFHVSQSLLQRALPSKTLNWFQVLLASLYSGAFHPTAEGQAAIADAIMVEARRVLARYASREREDGR